MFKLSQQVFSLGNILNVLVDCIYNANMASLFSFCRVASMVMWRFYVCRVASLVCCVDVVCGSISPDNDAGKIRCGVTMKQRFFYFWRRQSQWSETYRVKTKDSSWKCVRSLWCSVPAIVFRDTAWKTGFLIQVSRFPLKMIFAQLTLNHYSFLGIVLISSCHNNICY